MPLRAVIFDRDGVLTHFDVPTLRALLEPLVPLSIPEIGLRWQRWCERGGPRDAEEERVFWGGFWESIADELDLSPEARSELRALDYTRAVRAFPDSEGALRVSKERGLKVGVLSNFPLASLPASLDAAGLASFVDAALSAPVIGHAKPALPAYTAIARALEVEPSECLFFDDEADCVEGARDAGMHAYRVERTLAEDALERGVVRSLEAVSLLTAAQPPLRR